MKPVHRFWVAIGALLIFFTSLDAQPLRGRSNAITLNYKEKTGAEAVQNELRLPRVPEYHALIIGVSDYQYEGPQLQDLNKPIEDAERIFQVLASKYMFNKEKMTLLRNPTREAIINELDALTQKVKSNENVLVFYAGHGYYDRNTDFGFWLPSDAKTTSRANWIANSTVKDYLKAIPAKHTLLISDACFGGSIFKTRAVTALDTRKVFELYKDNSRKAMTSGNLTTVPDESIFIKYLIKVLEENEQDIITTSAIFSRLYEPVLNNSETRAVPLFGVIQGAGDEGGDFLFIKRLDQD